MDAEPEQDLSEALLITLPTQATKFGPPDAPITVARAGSVINFGLAMSEHRGARLAWLDFASPSGVDGKILQPALN